VCAPSRYNKQFFVLFTTFFFCPCLPLLHFLFFPLVSPQVGVKPSLILLYLLFCPLFFSFDSPKAWRWGEALSAISFYTLLNFFLPSLFPLIPFRLGDGVKPSLQSQIEVSNLDEWISQLASISTTLGSLLLYLQYIYTYYICTTRCVSSYCEHQHDAWY
jgi:hypothetical protein